MIEQTVADEVEFWAECGPEDLWNGPGSGIDAHSMRIGEFLLLGRSAPPGQVLDLGCGNGRLLAAMAGYHPDRAFLGLDLIARRPGYTMPPNAHMLGGLDGRSIPLFAQSAAAAWSVLMFQHIPTDAAVGYLHELGRVLVPGGRIAVQYVGLNPEDPAPDSPFCFHHSSEALVDAARDAGFEQVTVTVGGWPDDPESGWAWLSGVRA